MLRLRVWSWIRRPSPMIKLNACPNPKAESPARLFSRVRISHKHQNTEQTNMEKVRVDANSGHVVLIDVLRAALPNLHRQGAGKTLCKVLERYTGTPPSKQRVNSTGNSNLVGSLPTCIYLLDNNPGERWHTWRQEYAQEFKASFVHHVGQRAESAATSSASSSSDPDSEHETKTELMQKHLQAADISGSVRVNEKSGLASVIDVIKRICPGVGTSYAAQMLTRMRERTTASSPSTRESFLPGLVDVDTRPP